MTIDWKNAKLGSYINGSRLVYVPCAKSDDPRKPAAPKAAPKPKAKAPKAGK